MKSNEFGTFTLADNKYLNIYEGKIDWLGKQCDVALKCKDDETYEKALEHLRAIYSNLNDFNSKVVDYIVNELEDLVNDWNDEEPVSKEDFKNSLSISYIDLRENGDFSAYYDCGDVFAGHIIYVTGNVDGTFESATLAG